MTSTFFQSLGKLVTLFLCGRRHFSSFVVHDEEFNGFKPFTERWALLLYLSLSKCSREFQHCEISCALITSFICSGGFLNVTRCSFHCHEHCHPISAASLSSPLYLSPNLHPLAAVLHPTRSSRRVSRRDWKLVDSKEAQIRAEPVWRQVASDSEQAHQLNAAGAPSEPPRWHAEHAGVRWKMKEERELNLSKVEYNNMANGYAWMHKQWTDLRN